MLLRRITDFILKGRFQAMGAAFVCGFIPLIGTVSILIAGLVTLRKGIQEGALVLVAATLPVLISYVSFPADNTAGYTISQADAIYMLIGINVLTWLYACMLRRFPSWSLVLQFAGLVSIIAVVVTHVAYPDVHVWWKDWLTVYFDNVTEAAADIPAKNLKIHEQAIANMAAGVAPYATGILAMALSFYALLQLLLSRWWQSAIFNRGGLRKELLRIRLSYLAGAIFLIGTVLAYLGNPWFMDIMPAIYLMFALAGFSLLHYSAAYLRVHWIWLGLIYLGIFIAPLSIMLVAVVGLIDSGFDIRKRLKKDML